MSEKTGGDVSLPAKSSVFFVKVMYEKRSGFICGSAASFFNNCGVVCLFAKIEDCLAQSRKQLDFWFTTAYSSDYFFKPRFFYILRRLITYQPIISTGSSASKLR